MKNALLMLKLFMFFSVFVLQGCATRDTRPPISSIRAFPDERIALHLAIDGQNYYAFFFDLQFTSTPLSPNTDRPLAFRFTGPKGTKVVNAHEVASVKASTTAGMAIVNLRDGTSVSVRRDSISIWFCFRSNAIDSKCEALEVFSPPGVGRSQEPQFPEATVYRDPISFLTNERNPSMSYSKIMSADEITVDVDDTYQKDLKLISDATQARRDAMENWRNSADGKRVAAAEAQRRDAIVEAQRAEQRSISDAKAALANIGQQPKGSTLFCSTDRDWGWTSRSRGDAVDRQSLVCHAAGGANMPPVMGAVLLNSGWTIASEGRHTDRITMSSMSHEVEITDLTFRKDF